MDAGKDEAAKAGETAPRGLNDKRPADFVFQQVSRPSFDQYRECYDGMED